MKLDEIKNGSTIRGFVGICSANYRSDELKNLDLRVSVFKTKAEANLLKSSVSDVAGKTSTDPLQSDNHYVVIVHDKKVDSDDLVLASFDTSEQKAAHKASDYAEYVLGMDVDVEIDAEKLKNTSYVGLRVIATT